MEQRHLITIVAGVMACLCSLRIVAALVLVAAGFPRVVTGASGDGSGDGAAAPGLEDLLEVGRELWDEYAPPEIKAEYEFPTLASIEEFLAALDGALQRGSYAELATYEFDARGALRVLRTFEGGDVWADWLEPRLDYLTAAGLLAPMALPPSTAPQPPSSRAPADPAGGGELQQVLSPSYWDAVVVGREPPSRARVLVPRIKEIFQAEGVPSAWVWIAEVESSMNPKAESPAGARGLFQFMPATAERFGLSTSWPDERTDPEKSARAAANYLRFLHGRFGSWPLALAAYNAGEGRVGRALQAAGEGARSFSDIAARLPAETRLYVPKVLATVAVREQVDPESLPPPALKE